MSESKVAQGANEWDFSSVETPKSTQFLKMGNFILNVESGKFVKPEGVNQAGNPKTAYLEVIFSGEKGQVQEKYFITPKSLGRLQYLHLMLTGKNSDKVFKSAEDVGAYYEAMCKSEKIRAKKLHMTIGGEEAGNSKVYGRLPYSDYICDATIVDKIGWHECDFEPGTANWDRYLTKAAKNISHTSNDVMLSDVPSTQVPDTTDDLPF